MQGPTAQGTRYTEQQKSETGTYGALWYGLCQMASFNSGRPKTGIMAAYIRGNGSVCSGDVTRPESQAGKTVGEKGVSGVDPTKLLSLRCLTKLR